jgi:hypothetical protein
MPDAIQSSNSLQSLAADGFTEIVLRNPVSGELVTLEARPNALTTAGHFRWVRKPDPDAPFNSYAVANAARAVIDERFNKLDAELAAIRERLTVLECDRHSHA